MADEMRLDLDSATVDFYKIPSQDGDLSRYGSYAASFGVPPVPREAFKYFSVNWNRDLDSLSSFLGSGAELGEDEKHTFSTVARLAGTYPPGSFEKGRFGDVLFQNPAWIMKAGFSPMARPSNGTLLDSPELFGGNLKKPDKIDDAIKWSSKLAREKQREELDAIFLNCKPFKQSKLSSMDAAAWQGQEQAVANEAGPQEEARLGEGAEKCFYAIENYLLDDLDEQDKGLKGLKSLCEAGLAVYSDYAGAYKIKPEALEKDPELFLSDRCMFFMNVKDAHSFSVQDTAADFKFAPRLSEVAKSNGFTSEYLSMMEKELARRYEVKLDDLRHEFGNTPLEKADQVDTPAQVNSASLGGGDKDHGEDEEIEKELGSGVPDPAPAGPGMAEGAGAGPSEAAVGEKERPSFVDDDVEMKFAGEAPVQEMPGARIPEPSSSADKPHDPKHLPEQQANAQSRDDGEQESAQAPAHPAAAQPAAARGYAFTPTVTGADLRQYFYAEPMGGTPEFAAIRNSGAPIIINIYNNSRRSVFRVAADALKALPHVFASSAVTFYKGFSEAACGRPADKAGLIPQIGYSKSVASALSEIIDRRIDMRMDAVQKAIGAAIQGERSRNSLSAAQQAGGMAR